MQDNKIIPIQYVRQFDDNIRRVKIDNIWYFSILDIFRHYGQSSNEHNDWKRVQARLSKQGFNTLANLRGYAFAGSDGHLNQETPCVNFNTLLRIAQVANFKQWEYLRQYMADITEEKFLSDYGSINSETRHKSIREKSKKKRNFYTAAISETIDEIFKQNKKLYKEHFKEMTNITYKHILGAFKQELVRRYNFTDTQGKRFRDQFGTLTLSTIAYIEESAGFEMYAFNRKLSNFEQTRITRDIACDMADIFHRQCKRMGVDWLTNKPLLNEPDSIA